MIYAHGCGIGTIIKREAACTASIGPLFTPLGRSAAWAVSLGAPSKFDTRIITLRNAARRDRSLKYNVLAVGYLWSGNVEIAIS